MMLDHRSVKRERERERERERDRERERERVFTDHTLAHPLNCRAGVVARLSA